MVDVFLFTVIALIGIVSGYLIGAYWDKHKVDGTLVVDNSDPDDAPYLFVELIDSPNRLTQGQYVRFWVDKRNYVSHK